MQQSSATPSLHLWFLGVAEDCCMLSTLRFLVSTVFGTVSFLHLTSFLMILLVYWQRVPRFPSSLLPESSQVPQAEGSLSLYVGKSQAV